MTNPTDSDRATAERIVTAAMVGGKLTGAVDLRNAIAAEREAAAKVADDKMLGIDPNNTDQWSRGNESACRAIAAAIRARSKPNEGQ